jgi:hypothetical protein
VAATANRAIFAQVSVECMAAMLVSVKGFVNGMRTSDRRGLGIGVTRRHARAGGGRGQRSASMAAEPDELEIFLPRERLT